jgi:hypothetical protein
VLSKTQLDDAVRAALSGEWTQAHEIVQRDEENEYACWIHAVLHHQEGDLANASYWYARCGRQLKKGVAPEEELREIRAELAKR